MVAAYLDNPRLSRSSTRSVSFRHANVPKIAAFAASRYHGVHTGMLTIGEEMRVAHT